MVQENLNQKFVAQGCGISQPALSLWLQGKYKGVGANIANKVSTWMGEHQARGPCMLVKNQGKCKRGRPKEIYEYAAQDHYGCRSWQPTPTCPTNSIVLAEPVTKRASVSSCGTNEDEEASNAQGCTLGVPGLPELAT